MSRLNELGWDEIFVDTFAGSDTTKVERYIESFYVDSWRHCINILPKHYFNTLSFKSSTHKYSISDGTGFIVLPLDYYDLFSFKMQGWKKNVYATVIENDPVSSIQSNDYVRGNFCRPVCTVSIDTRYGRIMKYYSVEKGKPHHIIDAQYIPIVKDIRELNDIDDLGLHVRVYEPMEWINAKMVLTAFEKFDMAKEVDRVLSEIINKREI